MKQRILLLFIILSVITCKRESKVLSLDRTMVSGRTQIQEYSGILELKSGNYIYHFQKNQTPFKKIILLNTSMAGYISELEAEDLIIGVSSPEYIFSDKIQHLIQAGKIQNVGSEQKYDVEKIISIKPDAVFTNHIASFDNIYGLLKNNGIQVIFLDEYKEQKPLEKAAYIKIFGALLGKEKEAEVKYQNVKKNYTELQQIVSKAKETPIILANEMYGGVWYLPGGNTSVAHYIADANASYIMKDNKEEKALTMSFEEVYAKVGTVQYWINAGNYTSKKEMLRINPYYGKLDIFNKGKIYTIIGREKLKANDFFESGVVRADLMLKDYIKIFHPELLPDHQLIYMKELH